MAREEDIKKLREYLVIDEEIASKKEKLSQIEEMIDYVKNLNVGLVDKFDKENKEKYLKENQVEKPIKPSGVFAVFSKEYAEYQNELKHYEQKCKEIEESYYLTYLEDRNALIEMEKTQKEVAMQAEIDKYNEVKAEIDKLYIKLDKSKILDNEFYNNTGKLRRIIAYLENRRADSIKEALTLYFDEIRYQEIVSMLEENKKQLERINKRISKLEDAVDSIRR